MENLKEKWESIGILEPIPEDKKDIAAQILEDAVKYIVSESIHTGTDSLTSHLVHPILVRIMKNKGIYSFNIRDLVKDVNKLFLEFESTFDHNNINIDLEAEFCAKFADNYQ